MRHILAIILFIVVTGSISSQTTTEICEFDQYLEYIKTDKRQSDRIDALNDILIQKSNMIASEKHMSGSVKIIPVVVHVIHQGGSENISDEQIQSQITILNQDFRKIPGTNGDGEGVDTEIEFKLANIDPDGNCTNGIVRINSPLTIHDFVERDLLSDLSYWDATKYLNIYIVKYMPGGVLGYAAFPGGPITEDGIVVIHSAFGNIGTVVSPYNLGRTAPHEIGHWLGLYHTFNNTCGLDVCTDGDYVCDTPPVYDPTYGCPAAITNSCDNDIPDLPDLIRNYMDYTNDNCKDMFTQGQKDRAHATLILERPGIWSASNLVATGTDSNYIDPEFCNVSANFVSLHNNICIGNTSYFSDISLNNATSWLWTFEGGEPATSTLQNPTITYNAIGNFDVQLIASNALGTDTLFIADYIIVSMPEIGISEAYYNGFENEIFPPEGIVIDNPDAGITWERTTDAANEGVASARINNLININYGQSDALILQKYDFTVFELPILMHFNWAYARSDASYSDELYVLVSTDCGVNFIQELYKSGASLVTGPTQTTPFIPDSTQWKRAEIDLSDYSTENSVIIKIVNVTDGGNNLYIDSLAIGNYSNTSIENGSELNESVIGIYPNPADNYFFLENLNPQNEITSIGLFSLSGNEIPIQYTINSTGRSNPIQVNFESTLPSGIYFIKIYTSKYIISEKIIIQIM